jgi:hypothetical protein
MDTKTCQIVNYYDSNSYLTLIDNNYAYYIDLDKQYSLVRLNMSNKTLELLYAPENGKVINYNVYGNKIFFHVEGGDNAGLYRMNVDGTQLEYVAVGEISGIHCTSRYTFFSYYEDQSTLYRIPTTALINATINGLGISVLPNRMIIPSLKQGLISTVNVQDLIFSRNFYIIYHKDKFLTPSIKQFINLCKEYISKKTTATNYNNVGFIYSCTLLIYKYHYSYFCLWLYWNIRYMD